MLCPYCGRAQARQFAVCPHCRNKQPADHPDNPKPISYCGRRIALFGLKLFIVGVILAIFFAVNVQFGAAVLIFLIIPQVLWFPYFLINPAKWERFLKKEFQNF